MPPIYPPALAPGDTIAFVAPAGKLDKERMELARKRLEEMGFHVSVPENLYRTRGYLAGTDKARADELMKAFKNPEIKAIFPGTGYYGATRILDRLDYELIRKNPKVLIGFSDITAIHLAVNSKTGLVTFHSPNPMYGLGSKNGLSDFSAEYFWRSFLQEKQFDVDNGKPAGEYAFSFPESIAKLKIIAPGKGRGRLVGGNLSLVCALMGSEYEMDTDGKVLFLEDVGERPYRLDRYLSQLRLGGKLKNLKGVLLGRFSDCDPKEGEESLSRDEVFQDYFGKLGIPVIADFPAGHYRYNATLPIGGLVEIDADQGKVSIIEPLVDTKPPITPGAKAEKSTGK